MSIAAKLLNQCRKPSGFAGRLTLRNMNRRHAKVTEWGLQHIAIRSGDTILDIGCGGGRTIARLAALAKEGEVHGIDHSEESVAASRRMNPNARIVQGSVSKLPYPDGMFDLVTAVETHYYWPDLDADVREVLRVLEPGGTFLIIAEAYKGGKYDRLLQRLETLKQRGIMQYAHLTVDEHRSLLATAGFTNVEVDEKWEKGWLCARGVKP